MSEHDCLNNEDQLDSVLDEVAQIDSEFDSVDDIDSDLEKVVEVIRNNIETISVNGNNIEPDESKNINIEIPTTTSGFANDGDGTSPFATEKYVELYGGKIDSISIDGVKQTIDENKNVNIEGLATTKSVDEKITKITGLAPETLDSFEEIAKELGENETAINSLASKIREVENSIEVYSAGEGLTLNEENQFSVSPAQEKTFGAVRVWEEFGYVCISTEPYITFKNYQEGDTLTIIGAIDSKFVDGTLTMN